MKIYHAHGFTVWNDHTTGREKWEEDASFSRVFLQFEEAKRFLLVCFEDRLHDIYHEDRLSAGDGKKPFIDISPSWRKEYISEYVHYSLVISELDTERLENPPSEEDFFSPPQIDWMVRYTGEVRERYYVFGEREYECRESDLLPEAGTKFARGDFVRCSDGEYCEEYPHVYLVDELPVRQEGVPFENLYGLLYIDTDILARGAAAVRRDTLHEADLERCTVEDANCGMKEQLLVLQKLLKGEIEADPALWKEIVCGRILFNSQKSWREIPELCGGKQKE